LRPSTADRDHNAAHDGAVPGRDAGTDRLTGIILSDRARCRRDFCR
jgi:hypothetical protein